MMIDIRHGDYLEGLRAMPDASIDVSIIDPPYTEKVHRGTMNVTAIAGKSPKNGQKRVVYKDINFDHLSDEDLKTLVGEVLRVTKRWSILFCAFEQIGDYERAAGDCYVCPGVFRKCNSTPQISGDRPGISCEGMVILHRSKRLGYQGRKRWNGGGSHSFFEYARDRGERFHPTQKPIGLGIELVQKFSDVGEVILDTHMGSGTFGDAAVRCGRSFVGFEKIENYFDIAKERIEAASKHQSISELRARQATMFAGTK